MAVQTGIDALANALESAVSTKRTELSNMYAEAAFRHIVRAIDDIVDNSPQGDDRGHMLLGAALSGLAIENSMLGAAHASANPLTSRHDVIHGRAVAMMLPHVMRFNAENEASAKVYARFSNILLELDVSSKPLIEWVSDLTGRMKQLEFNADEGELQKLAEEAAEQWTGNFNPRAVSIEGFGIMSYVNYFCH